METVMDDSSDLVIAELEKLADLPPDEAADWVEGSGGCGGCLRRWTRDFRPFARLTIRLRENGGDGALLCAACSIPFTAQRVAQAQVPGRKVQLRSTSDPAHDEITDADRAWFEAHPHRRFRLRPTSVAELP